MLWWVREYAKLIEADQCGKHDKSGSLRSSSDIRDISTVFAERIGPVKTGDMTGKRMIELVENDTEMLLNDRLRKDPYTDEMLESVKLSKT